MSTRTITDKLLIKPTTRVWLSDPAHLDRIAPLPNGAQLAERIEDSDVALIFAADARAAREILDAHADRLARPSVFWVAYPKANRTDINRDSLWPILSSYGMRPIGQVAIDEVWSALRFRPLKPGEPPFTGGQ